VRRLGFIDWGGGISDIIANNRHTITLYNIIT
jgi:hypothetical protein